VDVRQSIHSAHAKTLDTQGLRNEFLVEKVFVADEYTMVYSHIDRIIVGGIMPITKTVSVGGEVGKQLGVSYFLERRELGVINIGGAGTITVDGQCYEHLPVNQDPSLRMFSRFGCSQVDVMTSAVVPKTVSTVEMNYRGQRPFQMSLLREIVRSRDLQEESKAFSEYLDSVKLTCGCRVPISQVLLGCKPDIFSTHLVICQSSDDGRTISSIETGNIRTVIADAAILTSNGLIYNAHVTGLDPKPAPVQNTESETSCLGVEFDRLESSVTNSDPCTSLQDDSLPVKVSEALIAGNTVFETVTALVDGATLAILQYCPIEGSVDPPVTIEAARKAFFDGIRRSVC